MSEPPVVSRLSGGVATVTLNRPAAMNSLDLATKAALLEQLSAAASDDQVRCVVLTGTGRAFCVGQDLREHAAALADSSPEQLLTTVEEHYNPLARLLLTMPKPVVAAVNGVAAGAGASLAFACDFRVLADTASFNLAFTGIGLSCDTAASWTLPRLVGRARALDLLYRPRTIPAAEAAELGLATDVVAAQLLQSEAGGLAARLAAGPTVAYAAIRRAVTHAATSDLDSSLALESALMQLTGATEDHAGAVASFLAKEPPRFAGR